MAAPKYEGMTWAEYSLLPDDGKRYEVLEGVLSMSPAPKFPHQIAVWRLGNMLFTYVDERELGVVVGAPMDVLLAPDTIVQPDIMFIREENRNFIRGENHGPPDLCIEVLSPSTALNDRYAKKEIYARCGVREYWIVDAGQQSISVYTLQDRAYGDPTEVSGDDFVRSAVVGGFAVRAREIFVT